jgi:predicted exporter
LHLVDEWRQASLPSEIGLRNELTQALQGTPLTAQRLAPFINEVQKARSLPPITLDSLKSSALAPVIDAMLLQRADKTWVALLPLQPAADRVDTVAVKAALRDLPGTQTIEIGAELTRLYARYLREAQAQALLGALGVVMLIALTLRSLRRVLAVCQPLLLSVLLTMGALAALGTPLGILHLVGLLLVVAVGSNYALFFDLLERDAPAVGPTATDQDRLAFNDTLASLLLANLTTVLSFGLLAFSAIPALSAIGRVVAPGAFLALLLSAAFSRGQQRKTI